MVDYTVPQMENEKVPMQTYLEEHLLQVWARVHPGRYSITEEYEVLQQSLCQSPQQENIQNSAAHDIFYLMVILPGQLHRG